MVIEQGLNPIDDKLRATLMAVAPGTELRDGLERILRGRTGGLIVLGFDQAVEDICSGGFVLDVPFSATRLRELAKMDGAVVLDSQGERIVRAAVQLLPDPAIPTTESGTRHRTAERVAKQTGFPVISVSQSMNIVALYVGAGRHVLEDPEDLASRTKQALAALERYRDRLDDVSSTLATLELEDLVTVRDVAAVAGRLEMVWRIGAEINALLAELGTEGRLLGLQYEELIAGVDTDRRLLIRDYIDVTQPGQDVDTVLAALGRIESNDLLDAATVAEQIGLAGQGTGVDGAVSPRGFRALAKVPRISSAIAERIVDHFQSLQRILAASHEDLQAVEGVGEQRAKNVRENLSRIAEMALMDRYV
ncbi:MAG: DNA integrity scanning diadenylate cyclase DisA [Bifidobacteriaceae bacterium]|jgi:diadenylate cyclase|nr:DNA integrity scanning diadenylate cyclase DisA [Bifidobacteriaceae bacterium]